MTTTISRSDAGRPEKLLAVRGAGHALERAVDVPDPVQALAGLATLGGTVRSWSERYEAEQACWAAPGVMDVANHLLIRS